MTEFLGRRATQVLVEIGIFDNFAFWIRSSLEDVRERSSWRRGLLASGRFRFLFLVGFALFLLAIDRLAAGLYGGSSAVVLILPVFAFAVERPM